MDNVQYRDSKSTESVGETIDPSILLPDTIPWPSKRATPPQPVTACAVAIITCRLVRFNLPLLQSNAHAFGHTDQPFLVCPNGKTAEGLPQLRGEKAAALM